MDYRERIEKACGRVGLDSQEEIAKACGVSQPAIHALLIQKTPMVKLLAKISEITGVSVHWLRDGKAIDAPDWAKTDALRDECDRALADNDQAEALLASVPTKVLIELINRRHAAGDTGPGDIPGERAPGPAMQVVDAQQVHGLRSRISTLEQQLCEAQAALAELTKRMLRGERLTKPKPIEPELVAVGVTRAAERRSTYRIGMDREKHPK